MTDKNTTITVTKPVNRSANKDRPDLGWIPANYRKPVVGIPARKKENK